LYCIYEIANNLAAVSISILLVVVGIKISKSLHKSIIFTLLRASFTKFYNKILTGRLMNRLSKDIYIIDNIMIIRMVIGLYFLLNCTAFLIIYSFITNWTQAAIIFASFVGMIYVFYLFLVSAREIARLEALSKSPILSFYSEIMRGIVYTKHCLTYD
jgi:ABC-type multidrug transport system fused ATPase/permease subunit